jgi:hypothetical protein
VLAARRTTLEHYFTHTAESDIDVERVLDAEGFDDRLARVVHPLAIAYERSGDLGSTFRHLMALMLRQFLGTHKSIRLLMKNHRDNPGGMADAMSLAREQVEKVYTVALLLEDPELWTRRYLKDGWRNDYERHLIEAYERNALERYAEYLDLQSEALERERPWLSVSEEEEQFLEWRFDNPPGLPKSELSAHLRAARETIGRSFPTPAAVLWEISDADLKRAMIRLYREYGYLCAYAHSGFRKLMAGYAEVHSSLTPEQQQKVVDTEYAQSILLSYLAAGFSCAEAATRELARGREGTSGNRAVAGAELLAELATLWDELRETSLLGKALYEMRTRRVLPPAVGAA